ncbi:single-stranded-DNA-specific exonuclease RecJ [Sporanaerobium hydrogeniformans]|uniref:single-stranded-DNA-specific exonuclease RecJ n=1 Tax=Sporanaerobium hydrogeniformans TaxID=3072179 RepID=UPI0015D51CA9|nr:single-stranded-DNA-specific exonuclease RecJ [Sporanaerobium hydrogeniformans]
MLPSRYKWQYKISDPKGSLVEEILYRRGLQDKEEIANFLAPTKESLYSPYLLKDMEKAVERLIHAKEKKEQVVVYGDYDVDGITSTSILYLFLKEIGYKVSYYIPNRQVEGYGLNKEALAKINTYAQLVITVDTGIAANREADFAKSIGMDLIITDHHECQEVLPDAYCIINPKRKDSNYPFDALAGVGVTFKLIQALGMKIEREELAWKYIDIVALGTVADVVPLVGENRIITSLGFKQMQGTTHVGLEALLTLVGDGNKEEKMTSNKVAYQIGPRINAAGRLSDAKIGVELLTTTDKERAQILAKTLDEENRRRQEMEAEILLQAEEYMAQYIHADKEKFIIVVGKGWHHGVIGIVASKLMTKYYRPTIVLTEEEGILSGSARSIEGFNIFEAVNSAKEELLRFGGHEMAAGLSLEVGRLEAFKQKLEAYSEQFIDEELLIPTLNIDLTLDEKTINLHACEEIEQLEPFGAANPSPIFCVRGKVQYAQKIGQNERHLRLTLRVGEQLFSGIGFDKGELVDYLSEGEEILVACEILKNTWNNRVSIQLRIKDIQSPEEERLRSFYYRSLMNYLERPAPLEKNTIFFKQSSLTLENKGVVHVYTEEGLLEVYKKLRNKGKAVNFDFKVCYNEVCSKNAVILICVNPLKRVSGSVDYEWDFKSQLDSYEVCNPHLVFHKKQLVKMIPSREDCLAVYRVLKNNSSGTIVCHKLITSLQASNMTEYKLFHILMIFKELGLLVYEIKNEKIDYQVISTAKTNLEHSTLYRTMHKFSSTILQLKETHF